MKAENWVAQVTVYELLLGVLLLGLLVGGSGVCVGYYLATNQCQKLAESKDHTSEVLSVCGKALDQHNDRAAAWKASNQNCEEKVNRYEAWILDVQESTGLQATVSTKKTHRGGSRGGK